MLWKNSDICLNCGEAKHIYWCPKPDDIPKEEWQKMSDDERLEAEEDYWRNPDDERC